MGIIDIENVEWEKFALAKSGRVVKLVYDKEPVQFCTSSLYTPFGVKSIDKDWSNFTEFYIECSLNNATNEKSVAFRDFMEKLDKKIESLAQENTAVFNTPKSKVTGDCVYSPMFRSNGTYPALMKQQFPRDKNGNFTSFFFDENKQKVLVDEAVITDMLSPRKVFKCIIECAKIWCFNGKIGSIWNTVQLKLTENKGQQANVQSQSSVYDTQASVYNALAIED
jgi:hypothetical protein